MGIDKRAGWGGYRTGSGRKKNEVKRLFKTISIKVSPELKALVETRSGGNIKPYIVGLIEEDLKNA